MIPPEGYTWVLMAVLQVWAPSFGEYGESRQPVLEAETQPIPWGRCEMYKRAMDRFYDKTMTWDHSKPEVVCEGRLVLRPKK